MSQPSRHNHPGQLFAQEFISGLIAEAGENLPVSEGGPTIGEALYGAGFEAGASVSDWLNPPTTAVSTGDMMVNVTDILNSQEFNDEAQLTFNENGNEYRLQILPDGTVQVFVDEQSEPLIEVFIADEVPANGLATAQPGIPTVLRIGGRSITLATSYAIESLGAAAINVLRVVILSPAGQLTVGLITPGNFGDSGRYALQANAESTTRFLSIPEDNWSGNLQQLVNGEWVDVTGVVRFDSLSDEQQLLVTPIYPGGPLTPIGDTSPPPSTDQTDQVFGDNTAGGGFPELEGAGEETALQGPDIEENRLTTDDIIMQSRWGNILINADDLPPNSNHQAHHIIPRTDARGANVRKILEAAGIDINDPTNLIWLPKNSSVDNPLGRTTHNQTLTNDYFNYLDEQLENATTAEIPEILEEIKNDLENGEEFESNKPRE